MIEDPVPSLSKDLLEKELARLNESPPDPPVLYNDRDRRLVSAYRSFVRFNSIKRKRELVLDEYLFSTLSNYLLESSKISYEAFKIISSAAPPSANKYFTAKYFLMFSRDENNCIDSEEFVKFIERSMDVENMMLNLMDVIPPGSDPLQMHVTEQDLESFLLQLIPEIDVHQRMHESFFEYYVYTASQKFIFFLDMRRTNMLSIKKIAHSQVMSELLEVRRLGIQQNEECIDLMEKSIDKKFIKNWFSDTNAVRLYSLFLELDKGQSGMLTMEEAAEFAGLSDKRRINFTRTAWQRIFEEYITYQPQEMDYKAFVNLVLAISYPKSEASIRYFWKVLDYDRSGRLTAVKVKFFYRAVREAMAANYDCPSPEDLVVEVFDVLGCPDISQGASLKDLITSKQAHTVISLLLDVNGFWRYDNRESLVHDGDDEDDEEEEEDEDEAEDVNAYVDDEEAARIGSRLSAGNIVHHQLQPQATTSTPIPAAPTTEMNENYDDDFDDDFE